MSKKDISLTVEMIGEVSIGYNRVLDVELKEVDSDQVVEEFGYETLLESMDFEQIKYWVEEQGFTVTEDE